jgi:GNAT superfamily N-acetyltransferase
MAFLEENCVLNILTDDILEECHPFVCGDDDMDEFFQKDALDYTRYRMGKSYCFRMKDDTQTIVACFTVSNDSIRIYNLPRSRRDYMKSLTHHEKPLRRYPGVLIGRLGVSSEFAGKGVGSEALDFVKGWFYSSSNKTGCRFVIVDAVNDLQVLSFYEKNGFRPLFPTEEQEFAYTMGKKDTPVKLDTRLMYFDLLNLRQED